MNYTEEDVRNAFKAGVAKGEHRSYFDAPLDEEEYLTELKKGKNNAVLADVSGSISTDKLISFVEWVSLSNWLYNGNTKTWYNHTETIFPSTKELMDLYFQKYYH